MKRIILLAAGLIVVGAASASTIQAREISYDITNCYQGDVTLISKSKELVVIGFELNGISSSNTDDKGPHGSAMHCVGINKIVRGTPNSHGYCRFIRLNGDEIIGEFASQPDGSSKWTALAGTGEFQGISGGGTNKPILRGKTVKPGKISGCGHAVGTYTVPD